MTVGEHVIADLYGVKKKLIAKEAAVRKILEEIAVEAELTVVESFFKQFKPYGVSGVLLISESHIAVHTWPEYKLVNIDMFTCGKPEKAQNVFELAIKKFKPKSFRKCVISRG